MIHNKIEIRNQAYLGFAWNFFFQQKKPQINLGGYIKLLVNAINTSHVT